MCSSRPTRQYDSRLPLVGLQFAPLLAAAALAAALCGAARGEGEPLKAEGEAPADHVVLKSVPGGALFVAKDLKQQFDGLLARVRSLQAAVAGDQISGAEALAELRELEPKLDALRKEIEAKKVLVSPVEVQTQTEESTFDLGPEQLLVITADRVRVVGWDKPQVKCVLEKSVFSVDGKAVDEELKAIRVVHHRRVAADLVGKTDAESDAEEQAFLASDAGRRLTEEQRKAREKLVREIRGGHAPYREFQGKQLDVLEIEGLTHQQGNRNVQIEIDSPGGDGNLSIQWRRHAGFTVYVPSCRGVLLRGCLVGLDVEQLKAPLTATDSGSRDRDYDGAFQIKHVEGPVKLFNVPLDRVEQVRGDVTIMATVEYANTGVSHEGGMRICYTPPPRECVVSDIRGDFTAWFARASLKLEGVSGRIDVKNEVGDTWLTAATLADAAHRIVSDCGRIEVRATAEALGKLPVLAVTGQGSVRTNADSRLLSQTNFTTGNPVDGSRRTWHGLKTPREFDPVAFMNEANRPAAALADEPRSAGLDLITRSGAIVLTVEP